MAYVLFTPERRNSSFVLAGSSRPVRMIGWIANPLEVGKSLLRTGGVWVERIVPGTDESKAVDIDTDGTPLFLRGGHWHRIRQEIYDEIIAAGFTGTMEAIAEGGYSDTYTDVYA